MISACSACQQTLPPAALFCQHCQTLVHGLRLRELESQRKAARDGQNVVQESGILEEMLRLLPASAEQHRVLQARLGELSEKAEVASENKGLLKKATGLGALGLLLFKFKWVFAFLFTKGKLLLLGLTKAKTFFSMALSMGLYWTVWGWQFALGFVLSIYVHEMGHVLSLKKHGIPASAPMFIPFVGAFVRLKEYPKSPTQDAEIGLAGPIYGLGAAFVCWLVYQATDYELMGAIARSGAFINLFNLLPVWQLDGSRGFHALGKRNRWLAAAAIFGAWIWSSEGLLLLLLLVAVGRAWLTKEESELPPKQEQLRIVATYAGLVFLLAGLAQVRLPSLG